MYLNLILKYTHTHTMNCLQSILRLSLWIRMLDPSCFIILAKNIGWASFKLTLLLFLFPFVSLSLCCSSIGCLAWKYMRVNNAFLCVIPWYFLYYVRRFVFVSFIRSSGVRTHHHIHRIQHTHTQTMLRICNSFKSFLLLWLARSFHGLCNFFSSVRFVVYELSMY